MMTLLWACAAVDGPTKASMSMPVIPNGPAGVEENHPSDYRDAHILQRCAVAGEEGELFAAVSAQRALKKR